MKHSQLIPHQYKSRAGRKHDVPVQSVRATGDDRLLQQKHRKKVNVRKKADDKDITRRLRPRYSFFSIWNYITPTQTHTKSIKTEASNN